MHGGGPAVKPGVPLDEAYTQENLGLVEKGCENLVAHIETVRKSGVRPVVCINSFYTDTAGGDRAGPADRRAARRARAPSPSTGSRAARAPSNWPRPSSRPATRRTTSSSSTSWTLPLRQRIELIAKEVYGADGVTYTDEALDKAKAFEADPGLRQAGHLHGQDPPQPLARSGPQGPAEGLEAADPRHPGLQGRGLRRAGGRRHQADARHRLDPAFRRIDVDVKTGKVKGLF